MNVGSKALDDMLSLQKTLLDRTGLGYVYSSSTSKAFSHVQSAKGKEIASSTPMKLSEGRHLVKVKLQKANGLHQVPH